MRRTRILCLALIVAAVAALLLAVNPPAAQAQCALCKTSVSNSDKAEATARTLNLAVVVLLVPPATIFCRLISPSAAKTGEETINCFAIRKT